MIRNTIVYQDELSTVFYGDSLYMLDEGAVSPCDLLLTDPPYGINLGKHNSGSCNKKSVLHKQEGYIDSPEYFSNVVVPVVSNALKLSVRGMVFGVPPTMWQYPAPVAIGGVFLPSAMGRNKWGWSNLVHCLLYGMAPEIGKGAYPTAFSSTAKAEKTGHPVTKPLDWMTRFIRLGARPGHSVFDPFCGSGSTLVAAKKLGVRSIGIDNDEHWCQLAAYRLSETKAGAW